MSNSETDKKLSLWLDEYSSAESIKEKNDIKTNIICIMTPIVKNIAKTIARRDYDPVEDLVQAGFIGLLKAIDNYTKLKNNNFRIYAGYLIIGEMKHYVRDKMHSIRVPRHIQELTIRINNFTKDLSPEEIQSLTSEEVANALDTTTKAVDMAMQAERRRATVSFEDVFTSDSESMSFEELIPSDDYESKAEYEDAKIIFNDVIKKLPPDQRVIIDMYYKQDMTKKEIADALVMSQMSVTRRMKQAFNVISSMIVDDSERKELQRSNIKDSKEKV